MIPDIDKQKNPKAQELFSKLGAEPKALIALHIEQFLGLLMREMDRAGFIGIEFVEKSEMMLRCVTSTYPLSDFMVIIHIFQQIDASFVHTEFYRGLLTLRQICTHDDLTRQPNISSQDVNSGKPDLIMFATHLVENLRQYFNYFRKKPEIRKMSNTEIKFALQDSFRDSLNKTILEYSGVSSNSH